MIYDSLISHQNFFLIAGPCAVEDEASIMHTAGQLKKLADRFNIPLVFKASYRKANRSSVASFTGIGDLAALQILATAGSEFGIPTTTDIHTEQEAELAAKYVDILQIPAFLCRQTSLLEAAAKTGKLVNIKKGQFLSPESMKFAADKVAAMGNHKILLTERGNSFGYQDLIVDFRSIPIMQSTGYPVVMDCTHALQKPNQSAGVTGGQPEYIEHIARAAVAVGVDGIFIETHPEPAKAKSDGANMLALHNMEALLSRLIKIRAAISLF
jgi:2-dehydro-3-deoxyphosphooctonate aldolase (KDO 8-P synthase)